MGLKHSIQPNQIAVLISNIVLNISHFYCTSYNYILNHSFLVYLLPDFTVYLFFMPWPGAALFSGCPSACACVRGNAFSNRVAVDFWFLFFYLCVC